jgi:hypothetical protein
MQTSIPTSANGLIPMDQADFIAMPSKAIIHKGVTLTRSTLIRAIDTGELKSRLFRMPGSTKGRRYILRESLDIFLQRCLVDSPPSAA